MNRTVVSVCFVLGLLAVTPAMAQDGIQGQWSVAFRAGAAVPTGGEFHEGGTGSVLALPTAVGARSSSDVYDAGFGWGAEVGYGVSPNVEVFGGFSWDRTTASELSVGEVAGLDLRADFERYRSWGLEGGVRYYFSPRSVIKPFVDGAVGFRRVDAIPGTFSVPAAGVVLADTPFYDESTALTFAMGAGVLLEAAPNVAVGVQTGFRYNGALSELEGLAGTGLENLNDAGSRWTVPVTGVVRVRF